MPARPLAPDDTPPTVRLPEFMPAAMPAVTPPPVGSRLSLSAPGSVATTPAALGTMPEVGETFLGFKLVDELGRGSFARVFLAEQEALAGRQVALKVTLKPNREAERLARLQHANVVPVYSVHAAPPVQVICMPFLGRRTIADQLRLHRLTSSTPTPTPGRSWHGGTRKRNSTVTGSRSRSDSKLALDPASGLFRAPADVGSEAESFVGDVPAVLRLLRQLADGLAHAHDRGVLHLDLKPANVLLADTGEPMLLDFNLAFDAREPNREVVGGTVPYMAPEQLADFRSRGKGAIDHRTDLYSLGVMAFEMLTGFVPFPVSARALAEFNGLIATRKAGPPSLCEVNPDISPAVEAIVHKLLAPEPADRYQSAADLRQDLDCQLSDRPLTFARDPSVAERFGKWRRRNPKALGRLVAVGLLAVVAGLGTVVHQYAAEQSAAAARQQAQSAHAALETLRLDLITLDDGRRRSAAVARATELLASHGLPADRRWKERSAFARLSGAEQAELAGDLGEVLLLVAHARWQEAKTKTGVERRDVAAELLVLNEVAVACFPEGSAPPFLARQRAAFAATAQTVAPAPDRAADQPPTARDLFLDAVADVVEGEHRTAVGRLEQAVAAQPLHAAAQFWLAYCRQELGETLAAIERYKVAADLMPNDPRVAFNLGIAFQRLNLPGKAEAEFTRAIELDPADGEAHYERAVTRYWQRKFRDAEADLNEAFTRNASTVRVYSLRVRVREAQGNRDAAAADRAALEAVTPTTDPEFVERGAARLRRDPDAALADFKAAAALNPRSISVLQNLAYVLSEKKKDDAAALAVLTRAVQLHPEYAPVRAGRAVLLARLGKRDDAHREADLARRHSTDSGITYQAACAYALTSATHPEDRTKALSLLRWAFRNGFQNSANLDEDPDLAPLRGLPEFAELTDTVKKLVR